MKDMRNPISPYRERHILPMGLHRIEKWKVKVYGLTIGKKAIDEKHLEHAILLFRNEVAPKAENSVNYGIGFLIVHDCDSIVFLLLNYYQNAHRASFKGDLPPLKGNKMVAFPAIPVYIVQPGGCLCGIASKNESNSKPLLPGSGAP